MILLHNVLCAGDKRDYSHDGPGFFTWHRLINLIVEWQIQNLLKRLGKTDYHKFRMPYWDWRSEMQKSPIGLPSEKLFTEERLGTTEMVDGYPRVKGLMFDNWSTMCWRSIKICDPRVSTGPLQRCPYLAGSNPCNSSNPDWPTNHDVRHILSMEKYDIPAFNMFCEDGFRGYIDANITNDVEGCKTQQMCICYPGGPTCDNYPAETDPKSIKAVNYKLHTAVRLPNISYTACTAKKI